MMIDLKKLVDSFRCRKEMQNYGGMDVFYIFRLSQTGQFQQDLQSLNTRCNITLITDIPTYRGSAGDKKYIEQLKMIFEAGK
jgi:hypothetical protein